GEIEQVGTPQEMYDRPATRFVASFIGSPAMNVIPCTIEQRAAGLALRLGEGLAFDIPADRSAAYRPYAGRQMLFGMRPEHITEKRTHVDPAQRDFSQVVQ